MDESVKQIGAIVIVVIVVTLLIGIVNSDGFKSTITGAINDEIAEVTDLSE